MSTTEAKAHCCVICSYPAPNKCSACGKAFYCSKEHQKTAWAKHKRLCKIFQRQARGEAVPADSYCGLCGKADGPLTKTDCCDRTVCDDAASYQMFSYAQNSCARNHQRYTRCCFHFNEGHDGDVWACARCDSAHQPEKQTWYMTNNFNFQEDIERADPPAFEPTLCAQCKRPMKLNSEATSYGPGGWRCSRCIGSLVSGIPARNQYRMDNMTM